MFKWLGQLFRRWRRSRPGPPAKADLVLGVPVWHAKRKKPAIVLPEVLRSQHLGIIGLSGTGKTHFIERLIRQDIAHGTGFAVFDVHGDLADRMVAYLAERASMEPDIYTRTVIIEPFDQKRTVGFNPLERTERTSAFHQANEVAAILRKRWGEETTSPRTEELLRNSLYVLSWHNRTLLDMPRILGRRQRRASLVDGLPRGPVRGYFLGRYDRLSPALRRQYAEPILSRLSAFVTDPRIRDIIGQAKSTFSFREAIEKGQWLIVNLSKGKLGENATILGSLLFNKLESEVMSLADVPEGDRRLFTIYADELQNLAGDTIERLVTEARKYRISLVSGHQFWRQLEPPLRQAMLGVGSKVSFRVHYHDAVELAGELSAAERSRYIKLLPTLDRGEAVVRIGAARPELIVVPSHREPHPSAAEMERLRAENASRHTKPRGFRERRVARKPGEAVASHRGNEYLQNANAA